MNVLFKKNKLAGLCIVHVRNAIQLQEVGVIQ